MITNTKENHKTTLWVRKLISDFGFRIADFGLPISQLAD
jgi:hypothetical protein